MMENSRNTIIVLHVLGTIDLGGVENRIMDLYRSLNRNKIQFYFAVHTTDKTLHSDEIAELGGKVYFIPKFNGLNLIQYIVSWIKLFRLNKDIDIVHGHMTTTAFIYNLIARFMGIQVRIAHSRNSNKDSFSKKVLSKMSRFPSNYFMAVSKKAAESEFGKKISCSKTIYFPNAINIQKFRFSEHKRNALRKNLRVDDDFVFGHVGRFHFQKNHVFLLKLFKLIYQYLPKSKLILVGEGELLDEINSQIIDLGLKDRVTIVDKTPYVEKYYSVFDAFIFPSLYEGLPGVLIEAQANGLTSFVSSNISNEVKITSGIHFIDGYNIQHWANYILENLPSKRFNEIDKLVEQGFDSQVSAKLYADFYHRTLLEVNE
mgnify:CR=1 FL=1